MWLKHFLRMEEKSDLLPETGKKLLIHLIMKLRVN